MRKIYFITTLIISLAIGVIAVTAANIEFKTINLKQSPVVTLQKPSANLYLKERQLMEEDQLTPLQPDEGQQTPVNNLEDKSKKKLNNYGVYSPKEYSATDFSQESVLFIIDFSSSMLNKVAGKQKIDMAIETMHNLLPQLASDAQLGLRIYGHKSGILPVDSCLASDLVVPVAPNSATKIYEELKKADAKGNTPITYSLKQAVSKDLVNFNGKKRIILLTDGGENCAESPCTYAMNVLSRRKDLTIDVIAFDINNKEADAQLKCTAMVTRGKFYKANTEAQLINSLTNSLNIKKDVQGVIVPTP